MTHSELAATRAVIGRAQALALSHRHWHGPPHAMIGRSGRRGRPVTQTPAGRRCHSEARTPRLSQPRAARSIPGIMTRIMPSAGASESRVLRYTGTTDRRVRRYSRSAGGGPGPGAEPRPVLRDWHGPCRTVHCDFSLSLYGGLGSSGTAGLRLSYWEPEAAPSVSDATVRPAGQGRGPGRGLRFRGRRH